MWDSTVEVLCLKILETDTAEKVLCKYHEALANRIFLFFHTVNRLTHDLFEQLA